MRAVGLSTTAVAPRSLRLLNAAEAGAVFTLLLLYIWYVQSRARPSWIVLLALVILSHVVRGETPQALGLRWKGFTDAARRYLPGVVLVAVAAVLVSWRLHTIRDVKPVQVAEVLIGYTWWALAQQYLLNGYFTNRLTAAFEDQYQYLVAPLAGLLFAAAHTPNVFLMEVTFVAGMLAALVYRRHRNLLFLALAHAVIGTTIWLTIPDSISHHLRVGPGMWG